MNRSLRHLLLRLVPRAWRSTVDDDVADGRGGSMAIARIGLRLRLSLAGAGVATSLRHVLRGLWRSPGFAAAAVVTMALGIGMNVGVFSIVDRLMFRPLPFDAPDRLVHLHAAAVTSASPYAVIPQAVAATIHARATTLEGLAHVALGNPTTLDDHPDVTFHFATVSDDLLDLLRVRPVIGAPFERPPDRPTRDAQLLLTWDTWRHRFGGRESIVGEVLPGGVYRYRVAGVLPPDFLLPSSHLVERLDGLLVQRSQIAAPPTPRRLVMGAVGRLKPGVELDAARLEIAAIADGLRAEMPDAFLFVRDEGIIVQPLQEGMFFLYSRYLYLLVVAVSLVWLVAAVNLATLMMARGRARDIQSAVRIALGAGRRHLVTAAFADAVVLCLAGGAVAVVACVLAQSAIVALAPPIFRSFAVSALDPRLLLITIGLAFVAAVAASLAPARRASRADLVSTLQRGDRAGGGRLRSGGVLLALEAAVGVVVVAGAAATVTSYAGLVNVDPGFDAADLYVFDTGHGTQADEAPAARERRVRAVVEVLRGFPGVARVGASSRQILGGLARERDFWRDLGGDGNVWGVTEDVFAALDTPVRAGRTFAADEVVGGAPLAVLSEQGARLLWPGEPPMSAVGRSITTAAGPRTVIGVVADLRRHPGEIAMPALFLPAGAAEAGSSGSSAKIVLRMQPGVPLDARDFGRRLNERFGERRTLRVESAVALLSPWLERPRFQAVLLGTLALVTLVLAAIGLYAIAAFEVARRRFEMGVRLALGATATHLRSLVFRQTLLPVLGGLAAGSLGAWWAGAFVQSLVFEVDARSPWLFAAVGAVLAATTVLATWAPARRAARTDPTAVLRSG